MPLWLLLVTLLGGALLVQRGSAPPADDKDVPLPAAVNRVENASSDAKDERLLAPLLDKQATGLRENQGTSCAAGTYPQPCGTS